MFPASDHRIQVFCCYQPRQFFIMLSFIITFFDIVPWNDYAFLHSRTVFSYKSFCRQAVLCIVSVIWLSVDQRNPINQSLNITLTTEVSCYLFLLPHRLRFRASLFFYVRRNIKYRNTWNIASSFNASHFLEKKVQLNESEN